MEKLKFSELGLSESLQKAVEELGYEYASEIQSKAIPVILEGKDIIGQSQTGTGKTAAFSIPVLEMMDAKDKNVQAIVLCPTRELALQVSEEVRKFVKYKEGIRTVAIYGGEPIERQIKELKKGVQIVIGTPGRVMDHMRRKTLKLGSTRFVILDEADEMLNMGFEEDIKTILDEIPARQTLLFSATMPKRILDLTKKYQNNPEYIKITQKELVVSNIEQVYFETKEAMKPSVLSRVLKTSDFKSSVIFCNTKKKVEDITENLRAEGFSVECLHGDMKQMQRDRVMKKFKCGDVNLLVATDVAARGIDVENLDSVFNYDLPQEEEYYVHRIGRTGRNGKSGVAYSFIGRRDMSKLREIEKYANTKLKLKAIPSEKEMLQIDNTKRAQKIEKEIEEVKEEEFAVIEELKQKYSAEEIAKALYHMLYPNKPVELIVEEERQEKMNTKRRSRTGSMKTNGYRGKNVSENGMIRLFINVGKMDKIAAKDIVGGIAAKTSISGEKIGKINILDKFSFVEVPQEYAKDIVTTMKDKQIKGKDVCFEFAKS